MSEQTKAMNWIDKAIGYLNPKAGLERARNRTAMQVVRKYEGATTGRRTTNWYAPATSASLEVAGSLPFLRNRSRDLVRNNPNANKAIRGIVANTIGTGIVAQMKNKNVQELWKAWAETTACDADGMNTFAGLQQLTMRTIVESGEVLLRKRRRPATANLPVPVQIQVLEPDYLDITKDTAYSEGQNGIYQGIEFDKDGRRVAYWLYPEHPGGRIFMQSYKLQSIRVPAEEVIHIFRMERPGQIRGVPWAAPVVIRTKDLDEYEDAQLVRQKIAACFTAFVKDSEVPTDPTTKPQAISEKMEPAIIEVLPPGKEIVLASPPGVGGDYKDYLSVSLHAIAAGFGCPYEVITGDYSQVNFSSGRMGWIEFAREIDQWRWIMFIPQFCQNSFSWFAEAAEIAGLIQRSRIKLPEWSAPRREMIDPTKEVEAMKSAVRSGFLPLSEALRQLGFDPDQVFEEYRSDNSRIDNLQLVLDSDPRKTNSMGAVNSGNGSGSSESKSVGGKNGSQNNESGTEST